MPAERVDVPGGEVIIRLHGAFTGPDAWAVHEALASGVAPVILDFSHVDRFEDFAIALVAPDLARGGARSIRIRGLGLHQRRILEYFGVRGAAVDERARWDGEPATAHA